MILDVIDRQVGKQIELSTDWRASKKLTLPFYGERVVSENTGREVYCRFLFEDVGANMVVTTQIGRPGTDENPVMLHEHDRPAGPPRPEQASVIDGFAEMLIGAAVECEIRDPGFDSVEIAKEVISTIAAIKRQA